MYHSVMPDIERSGTEARLLALLTSTPGQEFHTRDLVRRINGNPRPVQLALEKLLRQGLVESRRVGPLRMWRMDPANPLYPALREVYARTVGLVAQLRMTLEREPVRYAFVFGSYARGDDDVRSDVDVLIVGDVSGHDLLAKTQSLEATLGREINPVLWSWRELMTRARERAPFLMTLLAEPKIWLVGDEDEFNKRTREVVGPAPRGHSRDTPRPRRRGSQAPSRAAQSRARSRKR